MIPNRNMKSIALGKTRLAPLAARSLLLLALLAAQLLSAASMRTSRFAAARKSYSV